MLPGSPIARLAGEEVGQMSEEEKRNILAAYNLDKPLSEQFILYLKQTVTLQWGMSYSKKQPIFTLLKNALPWTLLLAGSNLLVSTILGTFLGSLSAFWRKKRKDIKVVLLITLLGSLPVFWVGMVFLSLFGVKLNWFPIFGAYSMWGNLTGFARVMDVLHHLALPLLTMVISSLTIFFTTSRFSVLNIMHQDYIRMAKIRGITKRRIRFHYIIRNAFVPVFTVFMTEMGFLLSGSVVIESLFSYPGLGLMIYEAVRSRDYPLMQYTFLLTSVLVILTTFLADLLRVKLDPRLENCHEK